MIEDLETGLSRLMADGIRRLGDHLGPFVRPLVAANDAGHPRSAGTAVLLTVGSRFFAVTAGHVFDHTQGRQLAIGGVETYQKIKPTPHRIRASDAAGQDVADVGFFELSTNDVQGLGAVDFLPTWRLDPDDWQMPPIRGLSRPFYLLRGYPTSRLKEKPGSRIKADRLNFLTFGEEQSVYAKLGLRPHSHLVVAFDRRQAQGSDGAAIVPPDPTGCSGGGFWRVDDIANLRPDRARLVAIATEWPKDLADVMVGTRVGLVTEGIRDRFPELDAFIPRSRTVDIRINQAGKPH